MKKILAFRIDRLGDYVICSNLLLELKKKFGHLTVVCSKTNYKLIKNQDFIDEIIIFDKNFSFLSKIIIFKNLFLQRYYLVISWDGKNFSNLCTFFLRSKYKLGIFYVKIKKIFGFNFEVQRPNKIFNFFFFNKSLRFTSRTNLKITEHLPSIYYNLVKDFLPHLGNNNKYFLNITQKNNDEFINLKYKYNLSNYLLIHFDEKFKDIKNIEIDIFNSIEYLSKKINCKIIVTSFKNDDRYYYNLKNKLKYNNNKNIILLEDLDINLFERLIKHSLISISSHSGFLVQTAGFNNAFIIDIINENEALWVSCWKPLIDNYVQIFKNKNDKRKSLTEIFDEIISIYEKKI